MTSYLLTATELQGHSSPVGAIGDTRDCVPLHDRGSVRRGQPDERRVQVGTPGGCRELPSVCGQGKAELPPIGPEHDGFFDWLPGRHRLGCQPEPFQAAQGGRGQSIPAALVSRERRLVDQRHLSTRPGQDDGRSGAGRSRSHHCDIHVKAGPAGRWRAHLIIVAPGRSDDQ